MNLERVILGALKSAAHDHPGSVDLNLASSTSKRIAGQVRSALRDKFRDEGVLEVWEEWAL